MRIKYWAIAMLAFFMTCGTVWAAETKPVSVKKGILLVAFGSSVPEGEAAIEAVKQDVIRAYPGVDVRVAYTSRIIMRKLAREQKRIVDEPAVALAKMAYEGFTDVAVLSTHIIPGEEYQDLEAVVDGFRLMSERGTKAGFRKISLSQPLLAGEEDYATFAGILSEIYPASDKRAVVLMGHGSPHFANAAYSGLQLMLWRNSPHYYMGTVEGMPTMDDIMTRLASTSIRTVVLAPAMLVAGDHARNDMAGGEDDSWKSLLASAGYSVEPVLKGLGEYPAVRRMLLGKFAAACD